MQIIIHSFRSLQDTFEARASEWAFASMLILMSGVFFVNDGMLYQQAFDGLRTIAKSQLVWAFVFLIMGILRLTVLIINGAYWRTPHLRSLTAFLSSGLWFMLLIGFLRNGSIMTAVMPPLFLLDAYNAKRAAKEAGRSESVRYYFRKMQRQDHGTSSPIGS